MFVSLHCSQSLHLAFPMKGNPPHLREVLIGVWHRSKLSTFATGRGKIRGSDELSNGVVRQFLKHEKCVVCQDVRQIQTLGIELCKANRCVIPKK